MIKNNIYTSGILSFLIQSLVSLGLNVENTILEITSIYLFMTLFWIVIGYLLNLRFTLSNKAMTLAISMFTILTVNIMTDRSWMLYNGLMPFNGIWHHDSLFHLSIIISIANQGIASIAQHGLVPVEYHTLSHHIDALILTLTNQIPYDVFTLLFFAKTVFVVLTILVYISFTSKDKLDFSIKALIFLPLIIQDGHITGSFGLSWTIPLMLAATHLSLCYLQQKDTMRTSQYITVAFFIVALTYGKISAAVGFISIICTMLFFKEYKNYKFYIFSFSIIAFFLYTVTKYTSVDTHIELLQQPQWIDFYSNLDNYTYTPELATSLFLILALYIYQLFTSFSREKLSISVAIIAFIIVLPLIYTYFTQRKSDIFYFLLSGYHVTCLILIRNLPKFNEKKVISILTGIVVLYIAIIVPTPFNKGWQYIASSLKPVATERIHTKEETPQFLFREEYHKFLDENKITIKDSLLFVPKAILEDDSFFISKSSWSHGLYIYSLLETPLINGVLKQQNFYGFSSYKEDSKALMKEDFDYENACMLYDKNIITVVKLRGLDKFDLYLCN